MLGGGGRDGGGGGVGASSTECLYPWSFSLGGSNSRSSIGRGDILEEQVETGGGDRGGLLLPYWTTSLCSIPSTWCMGIDRRWGNFGTPRDDDELDVEEEVEEGGAVGGGDL